MFWFGAGVLFQDQWSGAIAVGVMTAIFGSLLCLIAQAWTLRTVGLSAALLVLGLRARGPNDFQDGTDWFFLYWMDLVFVPFDWLLHRGRDRPTGILRDPNARSLQAVCLRLVLVLLLVAAPLPLILYITSA